MRLFIAVPLPDQVRAALGQLQERLAEAQADVKWVEPANLHLTLKFLGDMPEGQVPAIIEALATAARSAARVELGLGALGAFPSMASPRVVWVGLHEGAQPLAALAQQLELLGRTFGWPHAERPFSPHLTLGRVRSPRGRAQLVHALREAAWRPPSPWPATAVTLYQSVLSSSGPRYTALADAPLGS